MSGPLRATRLHLAHPGPTGDRVTLSYEDRLIRRRQIVTDAGVAILVDLPSAVGLEDGDALEALDGRLVAIRAAPEPLLEARVAPGVVGGLARLAWHVGNRHAPARIEADRLLVRRDRAMAAMLTGLGATLTEVEAPFAPEGGAYGQGRLAGHGQAAGHDHAAGDDHGHGG